MRFGCAVSLSIFYQCQTWVNGPYQNYKLKLITKQGQWPDIELQLLSTIPILLDSKHRKKKSVYFMIGTHSKMGHQLKNNGFNLELPH